MNHEMQVVNMMIRKMDDLSLIRSGCSTLQDLGLDNPVDIWSKGDILSVSTKIREELNGKNKDDLQGKYIILGTNLLKLSVSYQMYSNLADALIRIATIHAFEKEYGTA